MFAILGFAREEVSVVAPPRPQVMRKVCWARKVKLPDGVLADEVP